MAKGFPKPASISGDGPGAAPSPTRRRALDRTQHRDDEKVLFAGDR